MLSANSASLSISHEIENALTEKNADFKFSITETGDYYIDWSLDARGFITAVLITGKNGETAYQNLGENFSFTTAITLKKGDYTLSLTYLPDMEAVRQYLRDTGDDDKLTSDDVLFFAMFLKILMRINPASSRSRYTDFGSEIIASGSAPIK